MTFTCRSLLSSRRSFRLVNLTISFVIEHLAIFLKLIHCIAICIANGAAARNLGAAVPTSSTTTSLSNSLFPIISLSVPSFSFISMFFNQRKFFIHPALITHNRTRSTTRLEIVVPNPTS
jgi:hypothetical protein